jgi:hypothetical protein
MPRLWDISPRIGPGCPVFPGDAEFSMRWTWTLTGDCPVNVSELTLSPHTGAHTDAPLHYDSAAPRSPMYRSSCISVRVVLCMPSVSVRWSRLSTWRRG